MCSCSYLPKASPQFSLCLLWSGKASLRYKSFTPLTGLSVAFTSGNTWWLSWKHCEISLSSKIILWINLRWVIDQIFRNRLHDLSVHVFGQCKYFWSFEMIVRHKVISWSKNPHTSPIGPTHIWLKWNWMLSIVTTAALAWWSVVAITQTCISENYLLKSDHKHWFTVIQLANTQPTGQ